MPGPLLGFILQNPSVHANRIAERQEKIMNDLRNFMFSQINKKYDRCLWPTMACKNISCRAHSIQNRKVLKTLSENGHVVMFKGRINLETGPDINFGPISRNEATTFTGLCNPHDTQLFSPIDKNDIDINNPEHLFLLAYRSVFKGFHAKLKGAFDIQNCYMKGIDIGKFNPEIKDDAYILATTGLMEAHAFYCFKSYWDISYFEQNYNSINHDILIHADLNPSVAVSSTYSIRYSAEMEGAEFDNSLVVINVFPFDGKVFIIFSYPKVHEKFVKDHITFFLDISGQHQLYQISKLILRHCENFVISPSYFSGLTSEKIEAMRNYFIKNTFTKEDYEDERLYLF